MLGKRSRPLLRTASKLSFPHGVDCDQKTVNAHTCSKHPFLPQHVTVGFDIPQEVKPSDACESPRSVLDVNGRQPQAPSFRSCVRALPLRNRGSQGVGLAIIVDIHAEEKANYGGLSHMDSLCARRDHHHQLNSMLQSLHHQPSQPIAIAAKCRNQGQSSSCKLSKHEESIDDDDDDDDDDSSLVGSLSDMESFSSDFTSHLQEFVTHNKAGCNVEYEEERVIRPSIFSLASIPSNHGSYDVRLMSLLDTCALCQQAFVPGKDIFMYRGDQAFCSTECRGERIKIDEYKEKLITMCS